MIIATLGDTSQHPGEQWQHLVRRGGNAFMNPAALAAAADTTDARIVTLSAHDGERLVGFWALRQRRPLPFLPAALEALPYDYAFLSSPIIDPDYGSEVMTAFLAALGAAPALPRTLWLKDFDLDARFGTSIDGAPQITIKTQSRPISTREGGIKASGSTRKKLRQYWNRLTALGDTQIINDRSRDAALIGLDAFLALETASWKGGQGTALLNNPADAAFARRFIGDLAASGDASVALLSVNGKPIAAQILLYCGSTAYTWKTAFDERFAKYSPGAVLVDKIGEQLLEGDIETIDSCALDSGYMGQLWSGRKTTADLVVSSLPNTGLAFTITALYHTQRERLRQLRDGWRRRTSARARKPATQPTPAS